MVPVMLLYIAAATAAGGQVSYPAKGQAPKPVVSASTLLFREVTEEVGLQGLANKAASWVDFDNNGWTDLYVDGILWQNAKGEFGLGPSIAGGGNGGLWADFDNDGYADLYCWGNGLLFRNREGRSFDQVELPARPVRISRGAAWGDLNGDGWTDLYVGGYEIWGRIPAFPDSLLISRDSGRGFEDVWRPPLDRPTRGVTLADFDLDFDLDVFTSHYRLAPNSLWINGGELNWIDGSVGLDVEASGDQAGHTIGSAWGDLDSDGYLDLLVGNFSHEDPGQDRCRFLQNLGPDHGYRFRDRSNEVALRWQESYASPTLADYDNDGLLDIYLTTVYEGDTCVLLRNQGAWHFEEVTDLAGLDVERTYQAAWADFDNDGDVDLVTGGRLFRNQNSEGHWLKIRLVGGGPVDRSAYGTQVRVGVGKRIVTRQLEAGTGEGNQNEPILHFGLGYQKRRIPLEIRWLDGMWQNLESEVDRSSTFYRVVPPGVSNEDR
jgi:hypothetical protein